MQIMTLSRVGGSRSWSFVRWIRIQKSFLVWFWIRNFCGSSNNDFFGKRWRQSLNIYSIIQKLSSLRRQFFCKTIHSLVSLYFDWIRIFMNADAKIQIRNPYDRLEDPQPFFKVFIFPAYIQKNLIFNRLFFIATF